MVMTNITEESTALVFRQPLRIGAIDPSTTDWLQSPIGSNSELNSALIMACVDVVSINASAATVVDFQHADVPASVRDNINPTAIVSLLSVENISGGNELPTLVRGDGTEIKFTTAGSTAGDTYRLTFIYR